MARPDPSSASVSPDGRQLSLRFPAPNPTDQPLIIEGPYAPIRRMLDRWKSWPEGQLAVIGPEGAGKTRIALQWAQEVGAALVDGVELSRADIAEISNLSVKALVIDNADKVEQGPNLLAALNLTRDRRVPILVTGRSAPSGWPVSPNDLVSRLTAIPVVQIGPLDDETLTARLTAACRARFMKLPPETAKYLADRMERSHSNVDPMAKALEQAADGRALTKVAAKRALEMKGSPAQDML